MKHIPNILSFFRILLIPFFVYQMLQGNTFNAGIILIVSGLTDFLDGNLARKFNWVSDLGKVLDPVADKLTQTAISLVLIYSLKKYWYFFAIMISKDLIMLIFGGYLVNKGIKLKGAKLCGKVSTFAYYIVTIFIVLFPSIPENIIVILLSIITFLALLSVILYIPEYFKYKDKINHHL